ncbi:hypothetical protein GJ744_009318 [Endocarpon pusillum]|uniref:Uncharacterized protein n=1 Tax=Endocarpon pusillum TaxID=364733 RepID=A0A8H7AJX8_9EURO|nr:hypothetical protein GJ744_009318 [Endocarpon pusillum]
MRSCLMYNNNADDFIIYGQSCFNYLKLSVATRLYFLFLALKQTTFNNANPVATVSSPIRFISTPANVKELWTMREGLL